ncbi:hypothetical protein DEO72_LG4g1916 [Vigna unguiculata]|uniref:Uncharacterized protein n=1 Tax=Vigna unguiculata TaxID=3917 RepID=A0A4D6LSL8_VIGUN|nr:hypothetical protein DEO72_LG4g1916 [Vigna unguiculata]
MCIKHLFYVHVEGFLNAMNARGTVTVMLNSPRGASVNSLPSIETLLIISFNFMAEKTMLLTSLVFLILLLQHNFGVSVHDASRVQNLHPPPDIPRVLLRSPQPPSLRSWYAINDEKSDDAFRPTSPGHSPGVGHQAPPP